MRIRDGSSDVCSSDLVDHDRLALWRLRCGQALHHADEDAFVAPPLPAIIKRLRRAILPRRITPPEPIAVDEDDPAQNPSIVDPLAAMALRKIRLKTRHLLVRQPIQITHHSGPRSEEHTSELQSLMRNSYAVFFLKKTNKKHRH